MSELVLERARGGEARSAKREAEGRKKITLRAATRVTSETGTCRINPLRLAARKLRGERVHGSHPPLYPGVVAERAN